jgi:hypothetical protein
MTLKQKLLTALIVSIIIFIGCIIIISLILSGVIPVKIEIVSVGKVNIDSQGQIHITRDKIRATGPIMILLKISGVVSICALVSIIIFGYMYYKQ